MDTTVTYTSPSSLSPVLVFCAFLVVLSYLILDSTRLSNYAIDVWQWSCAILGGFFLKWGYDLMISQDWGNLVLIAIIVAVLFGGYFTLSKRKHYAQDRFTDDTVHWQEAWFKHLESGNKGLHTDISNLTDAINRLADKLDKKE